MKNRGKKNIYRNVNLLTILLYTYMHKRNDIIKLKLLKLVQKIVKKCVK